MISATYIRAEGPIRQGDFEQPCYPDTYLQLFINSNLHNTNQSPDIGQDLPPTVRPHVCNSVYHQIYQTAHAMPARLTPNRVCSTQTQYKHLSHDANQSKKTKTKNSTLVDTTKQCLRRSPLCTEPSSNDNHNGCFPASLGAHLRNHRVQGRWSPVESTLHINLLELQTVHSACSHFLPMIKDRAIKILSEILLAYFI